MAWSRENNLILSILNRNKVLGDLSGIETERFLNQAKLEGVSALLFHNLKEGGLLNLFPHSIQKSLKESYLLTLSSNMILMKDLETVITSLEENGVKTIVLKGAALLKGVYPDIGMRPLTDIDLLFCDGGEKEAGRILESLGYTLISTLPMVYFNGRTVFDIHTEIDSFTRFGYIPYTPKLDNARLWEDGHSWKEGFSFVRILSTEDTVLTLSIHLMKHSFLLLLWSIDIIEVIKRYPGLDWRKIRQRAGEAGFERSLFYVFSFLKEVFGTIPEEFLKEISPKRLRLIEKGVMRRILRNQCKEGYGEILYLYLIKGTLRRILFALRILFPSRDKVFEISGSSHPYLYYLKRVLGFISRGGRTLWNYILDGEQSPVSSPRGEKT